VADLFNRASLGRIQPLWNYDTNDILTQELLQTAVTFHAFVVFCSVSIQNAGICLNNIVLYIYILTRQGWNGTYWNMSI